MSPGSSAVQRTPDRLRPRTRAVCLLKASARTPARQTNASPKATSPTPMTRAPASGPTPRRVRTGRRDASGDGACPRKRT